MWCKEYVRILWWLEEYKPKTKGGAMIIFLKKIPKQGKVLGTLARSTDHFKLASQAMNISTNCSNIHTY